MAKKPGPGICVHCLREFDVRNWDHVLPRSWYPNATPQNLHKWQIPTCKKCNSDYGVLEEELLVMLALCVTPRTQNSAGIYERALRSINPSVGKDQRDKRARQARLGKIKQILIRGEDIPSDGIYPGLGERWNRERDEQIAVRIPEAHIRKFCEKIVRGITFVETKRFIRSPFQIDFYALDEDGARPIKDILDRHGVRYVRGPGFEVIRVIPFDEPLASIFKITIFGEFVMYATVMPQDA